VELSTVRLLSVRELYALKEPVDLVDLLQSPRAECVGDGGRPLDPLWVFGHELLCASLFSAY